MNVTLRQLRAFLAVARMGSFTKASELLHLTQPALTVQIRQLEEALELRLFDRTTRQVSLTHAGSEIAPVLQALLTELDTVVDRSRELAHKKVGAIRLACLPSFAAAYLPQAISLFRTQHPDIGFILKDEIGSRIAIDVRQEMVEFGITDIEVDAPDLTSTLLLKEPMHVFFPSSHPIRLSKWVSTERLSEYPLILMSPESNARTMVDLAFASKHLRPVTSCEVIYMSTAIGMVRAGLGIAILPRHAVDTSVTQDLSSRAIDDPMYVRNIAVVTKSGRSLSPASKAFVEILKAQSETFQKTSRH